MRHADAQRVERALEVGPGRGQPGVGAAREGGPKVVACDEVGAAAGEGGERDVGHGFCWTGWWVGELATALRRHLADLFFTLGFSAMQVRWVCQFSKFIPSSGVCVPCLRPDAVSNEADSHAGGGATRRHPPPGPGHGLACP